MWVLGIETTTPSGSVALLHLPTAEAVPEVIAELPLEARNYAASLFSTTERALTIAGITLAQVDLFAVADGPGSFTGERVGLTAVKAWIEVLGKPAVNISTLRAIGGPVALMDAGRGDVYYGRYPPGDEGLAPASDFTGNNVRRQSGLLAAQVARLGLADFTSGRALGPLQLDARYLQRPAIS